MSFGAHIFRALCVVGALVSVVLGQLTNDTNTLIASSTFAILALIRTDDD